MEIIQLAKFKGICTNCSSILCYEWADLEQPRIPDEPVVPRVKCPVCDTWIRHNPDTRTYERG